MASKARAYAEQARADYNAYVSAGEADAPSVGEQYRLHLLQMALEKMAKAFLYSAEPDARYSHHVVVAALNRLGGTYAVAEAVGVTLPQLVRLFRAARPILLQVEASSPSVGPDGRALTREQSEQTQNIEYPWQRDPADPASWIAPVTHPFAIVAQLRRDPNTVAAVRLLDRLIHAADLLLPRP